MQGNVLPKSAKSMFTFSSKLWYNKQAVSKKDGYVSLYLQVYIGYSRFKEMDEFKLHLRWPVDKIDKESSVLLSRFKDDPDVNDYNMMIMTERTNHNEIAKLFRLAGRSLNLELFKRELKISNTNEFLVSYMEKARKDLYRKKIISEQTYKNVGSTIFTIRRFQIDTRFIDINRQWIMHFKAWMMKEGKETKSGSESLEPGTVWTKIRDLKHYLNLANDEVTISVDKAAIDFPNPEPQQITVYLNRQEIRRLMILLDSRFLSNIQHNVLRAFLFQCFTSLRISDIYNSGKAWITNKNMLSFTMHKNHEKKPKAVMIPLVPMANRFIDATLKSFFDLPSEQEYNRTLKELASMAEIEKNVTSHVGRHTFGYLYMTTVGNIYGLKKILGHTKITTTERYAHLDNDYQLEETLQIQDGF